MHQKKIKRKANRIWQPLFYEILDRAREVSVDTIRGMRTYPVGTTRYIRSRSAYKAARRVIRGMLGSEDTWAIMDAYDDMLRHAALVDYIVLAGHRYSTMRVSPGGNIRRFSCVKTDTVKENTPIVEKMLDKS